MVKHVRSDCFTKYLCLESQASLTSPIIQTKPVAELISESPLTGVALNSDNKQADKELVTGAAENIEERNTSPKVDVGKGDEENAKDVVNVADEVNSEPAIAEPRESEQDKPIVVKDTGEEVREEKVQPDKEQESVVEQANSTPDLDISDLKDETDGTEKADSVDPVIVDSAPAPEKETNNEEAKKSAASQNQNTAEQNPPIVDVSKADKIETKEAEGKAEAAPVQEEVQVPIATTAAPDVMRMEEVDKSANCKCIIQ